MTFVTAKTPEQIELCASLAARIWREHYTPIIGEAQVAYMLRTLQSAQAIASQISAGYRYRLAYEGEHPVGYLATVPEEGVLKISKLYLLKPFRGKGRGRAMLAACEREARERGFSKLRLTVNRHNPALGFYEKVGFLRAGTQVADIGGGFVMDDYVMELGVSSRSSGRGSAR